MRGDLMAQVASVTIGAQRLQSLFERYGPEQIDGCVAGILDAGEASMRAQIGRWKPGTYTGIYPFDDNASWAKNTARVRHLAQLAERVRALEKQGRARAPGTEKKK